MILGLRTGRFTQPGGCPVRSFFSMQILISQGRSVVAPEQHRDCSTAIAVRRPAKASSVKEIWLLCLRPVVKARRLIGISGPGALPQSDSHSI